MALPTSHDPLLIVAVLAASWVALRRLWDWTSGKNLGRPPVSGMILGALPGPESEAERMRKFLEALGLPPEHVPPRPVARPLPRPAPVQRPVRPKTAMPPPITPVRRPAGEVTAFPGSMPSIPELSVPEVAEFRTVASQITANPADARGTLEPDAYGISNRVRPDEEVRRLLQSPGALRSAILLREILGPPQSLQS